VRLPLPGGLNHIPLRRLPLALVCSADHRLAGATGITLDDLAGENLITINGGTMAHDAMVSAFRNLSNSSTVHVAADGWLNTISLARRGFGLALGPLFYRDYYPPDIALIQFADPPIMETAIVTRDEPHPHESLAEYIELYLERIGSLADYDGTSAA
jgi:DNA-binding transcriptional LysR family regulator